MLPEISGEELIEKIRKIKENMPIIMITALEDENKKITCFIKGADDYIIKPFSLREFILRVKALLRRAHVLDRKSLSYEGIELDLEKKQVKVNGKYKDLTKTEYLLLKYFLENPGKVLSKEELLQKFWQDEDEGSRVVDVYISRLRKKLGEKGKLIKTVPRLGYKLSK
jgi:DNA-binding response OmpR family regulator